MKKRIAIMALTGMMAISMTACGNSDAKETSPQNATEQENADESAQEPVAEPDEEVTYQSILDQYSQKLSEAAPTLVEEYNAEAAGMAGDINALAELSTGKIEKLAEISTEGMEKMSELMLSSGDAYETYEEWANKLNDVYMTQSQQLTAAYTASATQ